MSNSSPVKRNRKLLAFVICPVLSGWMTNSSSNPINIYQASEQPTEIPNTTLGSIDQISNLDLDEIERITQSGNDYLVRIQGYKAPDGTFQIKPVIVTADAATTHEEKAMGQATQQQASLPAGTDNEQIIHQTIDDITPEKPVIDVKPSSMIVRWPPDMPRIITTGEQAEILPNTTVFTRDKCTNGDTPCNIQMKGGVLTNQGVIQGTENPTDPPSSYVIIDASPDDTEKHITNTGRISTTASKPNTTNQVNTIIDISGTGSQVNNSGTINIDGLPNTLDKSGNKGIVVNDGVILTNNKTGVVTVNTPGATGLKINGTLRNDGTIHAPGEESTGVVLHDGTLFNTGTIKGNAAAVKITGAKVSEATFQPGSLIEGLGSAPAIDASTSEPGSVIRINLNGGRFLGDIIGGPDNDTLNINSSATPTDTASPVAIQNAINSFETININGNGWKHDNRVSGTDLLTTTTRIRNLYVNSSPGNTVEDKGKTETLRVDTSDMPVKVATIPDHGSITNLYIYGAPRLDFSYGIGGPVRINNIRIHSSGKWQASGLLTDVQSIYAKPVSGPTTAESGYLVNHISVAGPGIDHPVSGDQTLQLVTPSCEEYPPANRLNISANSQGLIDTVTLHDGAEVSAINKVSTINIRAGADNTRWLTSGLITDPRTIVVKDGGTIAKINVTHPGKGSEPVNADLEMLIGFSGTYIDDHGHQEFLLSNVNGGTIQQADFTGSTERPTLHFLQAGGASGVIRGLAEKQDILELSAGKIDDASGFARAIISGHNWQHSHITNPVSIDVIDTGVAHTISDQGCTADGELLTLFTPPKEATSYYQNLPAFTVTNRGGNLDSVTFTNGSRPKPLIMQQHGGTTGNIHGSPGLGDQLQLSGGRIGQTHSFESVVVYPGDNWIADTIHDLASIDVLPGATVKSITTSPSAGKPNTLYLSYSGEMTTPGKGMQQGDDTVAINSAGDLGSLDLSDAGAPRPKIKMAQSGGSIDAIISQQDDSLLITGGTIHGNISGPNHIDFNGKGAGSHFLGDTITTAGTVRINGHLQTGANMLNVRSIRDNHLIGQPNPTLEIAPGGKLTTPGDIRVDGIYRQQGELYLASDNAITDPDSVPLTAQTIDISPNARLIFDSTRVIAGDVIMQATVDEINRPVTIAAYNEQYSHYYAQLDDDQKTMRLRSSPISRHVNQLAKAGGAPAGATAILTTATEPKEMLPTGYSIDSRTRSTVYDPLNDFVIKRTYSAKAAARLAQQLAPDISGSVLDATRESLKTTSKAIAARNNSLRNGLNTGDLFSSGAFWVQYAYSDATQDRKDGVDGYLATINGFTLGLDKDLDEQTNAGIAYTYAKGDIDGRDDLDSNTVGTKNHIFSVYSSYTESNIYMDGRLSYATGSNNSKRHYGLVRAKYDTSSLGIGLTGSRPMPIDNNWLWEPKVLFNYYTIKTDDYSESPADPAYAFLPFDKVSNDKYTILELGAGIKIAGEITMDSMILRPEFSLMGFHDFKDDPVTITAHFASGGNNFVVHGASRDNNRFQFSASLGMEIYENTTLTVSYSYDWMESFKANGFLARARYMF